VGFAEVFLGAFNSWFSQSCCIVQGGRGAKTTWSVLCGARKYPYLSQGGLFEISRERGVLRSSVTAF